MTKTRKIYCCGCNDTVSARLTNGAEIYPHRKDLKKLPFWKCDTCNNYVGCHHKTSNRTKPLGVIPTQKLRKIRRDIHDLLDPIWKSGKIDRTSIYAKISKEIGYEYHTATLKSVEDAYKAYKIIQDIAASTVPECIRTL